MQVGTMFMRISYGIVLALLASFPIHLILRGLWIGLIGLQSVFPQGVDWERLARTAPITTKYQHARMPTIESSIASVNRVASVVFICASLLVGMTLTGALIFLPVFLVTGVQVNWLLGILVVLMLPVLLQVCNTKNMSARIPAYSVVTLIQLLCRMVPVIAGQCRRCEALLMSRRGGENRIAHSSRRLASASRYVR